MKTEGQLIFETFLENAKGTIDFQNIKWRAWEELPKWLKEEWEKFSANYQGER